MLRECRKGDQDACRKLAVLVSRLRSPAIAALVKIGAEFHDAEDAVADAILAALLGAWRRVPRNWAGALFLRARTCLFKSRQRMRLPRYSRLVDAGTPMKSQDLTAAVAKLLRGLTPRERHVLMGRVSGLSYRAIAECRGTTEGAARVHFANARAKLLALRRREVA
jgi:DNA-directed RNA polymerase specialized sigma24 family protein